CDPTSRNRRCVDLISAVSDRPLVVKQTVHGAEVAAVQHRGFRCARTAGGEGDDGRILGGDVGRDRFGGGLVRQEVVQGFHAGPTAMHHILLTDRALSPAEEPLGQVRARCTEEHLGADPVETAGHPPQTVTVRFDAHQRGTDPEQRGAEHEGVEAGWHHEPTKGAFADAGRAKSDGQSFGAVRQLSVAPFPVDQDTVTASFGVGQGDTAGVGTCHLQNQVGDTDRVVAGPLLDVWSGLAQRTTSTVLEVGRPPSAVVTSARNERITLVTSFGRSNIGRWPVWRTSARCSGRSTESRRAPTLGDRIRLRAPQMVHRGGPSGPRTMRELVGRSARTSVRAGACSDRSRHAVSSGSRWTLARAPAGPTWKRRVSGAVTRGKRRRRSTARTGVVTTDRRREEAISIPRLPAAKVASVSGLIRTSARTLPGRRAAMPAAMAEPMQLPTRVTGASSSCWIRADNSSTCVSRSIGCDGSGEAPKPGRSTATTRWSVARSVIWWRQMLCEVPPLWSSTTPGPWSPARCTATCRSLCRNHSGDAPCGGPSLGFGDRCALLLTVASCTATSDNDHSPNGCYPQKVGVPTPTRQCFFLAHRRKPPRSTSAHPLRTWRKPPAGSSRLSRS